MSNNKIKEEELVAVIKAGEKHLEALKNILTRMQKERPAEPEPIPWPQEGDEYEYLNNINNAMSSKWCNGPADHIRLRIGNVFKPGTAKDSLIYKLRHSEYEYWIPDLNMPVPDELPEGCEYFYRTNAEWFKEGEKPSRWVSATRRWPKGGESS